jgi:molybdopterin-guanine dinucleotide biosynthesis protein A
VTFAVDAIDDRGPVVGLRTALRESDRLTAVVVGCDTPLIPSVFLAHLLDRVESAGTAAVVTRVDGRLRPLPAAVNVRAAAAACTEVLVDGSDLTDVMEALAPVVIPEREVQASVGVERLLDVDTRADLARAERLLARGTAPDGGGPDRPDDGGMQPNSR